MNTEDPAWPLVRAWLAGAKQDVQILPRNRQVAEQILLQLQLTTRSPLGAVIFETGGLMFDHGWLRFLGSGSPDMRRDILIWNQQADGQSSLDGALLVAGDVVGGVFALNGGRFPAERGSVFYMAPDTLEWEDLAVSYSQLLQWAAGGDLTEFYQNMRWSGWERDLSALTGDEALAIYPPLWADGKTPITDRSRRVVSMSELWRLECDWAGQIKDLPQGSTVRIVVEEDSSGK